MKLKLTRSFKTRLATVLTGLLFDLSDGTLDTAEQTAAALRSLADEIEAQNPA